MSSLRRDLFEQKLWLVVAILVVAIVATPVIIPRTQHSHAPTLPPAPRAAGAMPETTASTAVIASRQATVATDVKLLAARLARDPFASGLPHLQSKPGFQSGTSTSASTASTATVTPAPVSTSSASGGSSTAASTTTPTTPTTTPTAPTTTTPTTTTAPTSSTPTSSTTPTSSSTTTEPAPTASAGPWTVYSVDVRIGAGNASVAVPDIARLTPLPAPSQPAAMFMGVLSGGDRVVFDLAAGETPSGPGLCVPSHYQCAAIELRAGQTEKLTSWQSYGAREVTLHVGQISDTVTHSQQTALAAYERHSAAGLCELALADPVLYNGDKGTLTVAGALCEGQHDVVPFPGPQGSL